MIGHAEVLHNLYIFYHPQSSTHSITSNTTNNATIAQTQKSVSPIVSFDLWHFRLGHHSLTVMQQICTQFPYIAINKNIICDSCYLAKQCKLPFPTSKTQSFQPFDLIYMDIWGPLSICSFQGHQYFLTMVMTIADTHGYI